jgi:hypothetical protein
MSFSLRIDNYLANFPLNTGSTLGTNSVVIGDINNDLTEEFIAATLRGELYSWSYNGSAVQASPSLLANLPDSIQFSPALADLDNDGGQEIIVGDGKGIIRAFKSNGSAYFQFDCGKKITSAPSIISLSNKTVLVGLEDGTLTALQSNGGLLWQKKLTTSSITGIAQFNSETAKSIVVTSSSGEIVLVSALGEVIWRYTSANFTNPTQPVVGDINHDGHFEIIVANKAGKLIALNASGAEITSFQQIKNDVFSSNPILADFDHDGYLEILVAAEDTLFAYTYNGVTYDNFPITIRDAHIASDPVVVDLNGDQKAEIIVATNQNLYAFHSNGVLVDGFPYSIGASACSTPFISDFDNNGIIDFSVATSDGFIYGWDSEYSYQAENVLWGSYLHDPQHTAIMESLSAANPKYSELMPAATVYNYPNPTKGNSTTIRYWLKEAAQMKIRIYDLAGELIKELNVAGLGQTDNEVALDLHNIESGVYLTRVEATSSTESTVTFFKLAVVK